MAHETIALSNPWEFRGAAHEPWQPIAVPGCWEQIGVPKIYVGPCWYRSWFDVSHEWANMRLWLRFGAVSYHCEITVNGQYVGSHTGMWDAFEFDITNIVISGQRAELVVQVEKSASLTNGPASASLPGRFPLKQTLAGFLPYVWGHAFGGIWQDVVLAATGENAFSYVCVRGDATGRVQIEARHTAAGDLSLLIRDRHGATVYQSSIPSDGALWYECNVPLPELWSPEQPSLYTAVLRLGTDDERIVRFGLRTLAVEGTTLLLNGRPIYPRMALSWGWYPKALHSNPGPAQVRADMLKLQSLGFNGIKLCLWFPPQYYFALADELGMFVWVELPMWLPDPTSFFRQQTPIEYDRLVRQARDHPSVILYTLGCELNRTIDDNFLRPLFAQVKALAGDALVRDNSGSGEAYGGLLREYAEFYDYHFYSEFPYFHPLLDAFSPRWRPEQPWVFGEFCDYDTFRDPTGQGPGTGDHVPDSQPPTSDPWWMSRDPEINPQGARWQYDLPFHAERLQANGMQKRSDKLTRLSYAHSLLHRKWTLETVRLYREVGGYVVTGEADTPISTAGMWDDLGQVKLDPATFRGFNADTVVLVGWDKRRSWQAGGDRAAFWDTWSYGSGTLIRPHFVVSHYAADHAPASIVWQVHFAGEAPFAGGAFTTSWPVAPGTLRELLVAEFRAPAVTKPRQATLRAAVQIGNTQTHNTWPLWIFPANPLADFSDLTLFDPHHRFDDLRQLIPGIARFDEHTVAPTVAFAAGWTEALDRYVRAGGRAILVQDGSDGPLPTVEMPFWREAMRLCEPHSAWGDFPHHGWAGLQFFGCAPDRALDSTHYAVQPILRRLDTRTMAIHDYACTMAWGSGHLILTTLRFEGGQGTQPLGISRNTAAAYLLGCWLRFLQS